MNVFTNRRLTLVGGLTIPAGTPFVITRRFWTSAGERVCLADATGAVVVPFCPPEFVDVEPEGSTDA